LDTVDKIAFQGRNGIYITDLNGEIKRITFNNYDYLQGWLPNGNGIIYLSIRRDTWGDGKVDITYDSPDLLCLDLIKGKEEVIMLHQPMDGFEISLNTFIAVTETVFLYDDHNFYFKLFEAKKFVRENLLYVRNIGLRRIYHLAYCSGKKIIVFTGIDSLRYTMAHAKRPIDTELEENSKEIYRINLDMTGFQRLTYNDWCDDDPAISPDGKYIAFASNRDGDFDIYIMDINGKNIRQLTHNDVDDRRPTWSPDGKWIAYDSRPWLYREIWIMSADGSGQRPLVQISGSDCYNPRWSPKKSGGNDGD